MIREQRRCWLHRVGVDVNHTFSGIFPSPPLTSCRCPSPRYIAGCYTYVAKSKPASPGGAAPEKERDPMVAALEGLYERHGGDLAAIFGALEEDPTKALKYARQLNCLSSGIARCLSHPSSSAYGCDLCDVRSTGAVR